MRKASWKFNNTYCDVKKLVDQIDRASSYTCDLKYNLNINENLVCGSQVKLLLKNMVDNNPDSIHNFMKCQIMKIEINGNRLFLGIERVTKKSLKFIVLKL